MLHCFSVQLNIQIICHTIFFLQQKSSTPPEGQPVIGSRAVCSGGFPDRSGSKHVSSFDEVKARNAGEESAYDKAECFFVLQMPVVRPLMFEHQDESSEPSSFLRPGQPELARHRKKRRKRRASRCRILDSMLRSICVFSNWPKQTYPFAAQLARLIACQTWDHPAAEFSLFFLKSWGLVFSLCLMDEETINIIYFAGGG